MKIKSKPKVQKTSVYFLVSQGFKQYKVLLVILNLVNRPKLDIIIIRKPTIHNGHLPIKIQNYTAVKPVNNGLKKKWPLFKSGRYSEVWLSVLKSWGSRWPGRCRQVAVVQRWSLTQVWLYLQKESNRFEFLSFFIIHCMKNRQFKLKTKFNLTHEILWKYKRIFFNYFISIILTVFWSKNGFYANIDKKNHKYLII